MIQPPTQQVSTSSQHPGESHSSTQLHVTLITLQGTLASLALPGTPASLALPGTLASMALSQLTHEVTKTGAILTSR